MDDTVELEPVRIAERTVRPRRRPGKILLAAALLTLFAVPAGIAQYNAQVALEWQEYSQQILAHAQQLETLLSDANSDIELLAGALTRSENDVENLERSVVELSSKRDLSDDQYNQVWAQWQRAASRNRQVETCLDLLGRTPIVITGTEAAQVVETVERWLATLQGQIDVCLAQELEPASGGLP